MPASEVGMLSAYTTPYAAAAKILRRRANTLLDSNG